MQVISDAFEASDLPHGGIGTIGNYDGIHRGQRSVIDRVVERSRAAGLPAMVITFEPHPLTVVRPEAAPPRICSTEEKESLLGERGVDVLLNVAFTDRFSRTTADHFVRDFLHQRLGLSEVWVGRGFCFGHEREGDLELLQRLGEELGFSAFGADEVMWKGERVSSTRIRAAVADGRIEDASEMLGRAFAIQGQIVRGDRMGQRIGWPTINISPEGVLVPGNGVYATRVVFPSFPATFDSVTNVGTRPTVYENHGQVVESHVLDFSTDVYGERVELQFFKRLREEQIFASVMDLSSQIRRDVEATREYFGARRRLEEELDADSISRTS